MNTLFIVLKGGTLGEQILALAREHAAFDPDHRHAVRAGDPDAPPNEELIEWAAGRAAAAVVLNRANRVRVWLELEHATGAAWVEDAFVRAARASDDSQNT